MFNLRKYSQVLYILILVSITSSLGEVDEINRSGRRSGRKTQRTSKRTRSSDLFPDLVDDIESEDPIMPNDDPTRRFKLRKSRISKLKLWKSRSPRDEDSDTIRIVEVPYMGIRYIRRRKKETSFSIRRPSTISGVRG